ncbi:fibulin-1-like isoform X39 [Ptychodera flava]|uniref:fibulin-1-like isoform X39 n=1 Tax=Ptychodera flava TaxID=63121 RepID=UPI00396A7FB7
MELQWMCLLFAVISSIQVEGIMLDIKEECCIRGEALAGQTQGCTDYSMPIADVKDEDQDSCLRIMTVCCMQTLRESQCQQGLIEASAGGTCPMRSNVVGGEEFQECCLCCRLGEQAKQEMPYVSCDRIMTLGDPCDRAFRECCARSQPVPATEPPVASVTCRDNPCEHTCEDTSYGVRCFCHDGYQLAADRKSCDPARVTCRESPCSQVCTDTSTGVECSCYGGYQLAANGRDCEVGSACSELQCQHDCRETGNAAECVCPSGYRLSNNLRDCEDIDECAVRNNLCAAGQECVNRPGSYTCEEQNVCPNGYQFNAFTRNCEDINECALQSNPCAAGQQCVNIIGSFTCEEQNVCREGYQFNTLTRICDDVNECALGLPNCLDGQQCVNTIGSFECRRVQNCGTGYTLNALTQQCVDDNECDLGTDNCRSNQRCTNIPGSFRCENLVDCEFGYELNSLGACVDINECLGNPCPRNTRCQNIEGSYRCRSIIRCRAGYELNEAGDRCQDIDECRTGSHECSGQQTCKNHPGYYSCSCPAGYKANQLLKTCEDIDECTEWRGQCQQSCTNTPGSFQCTCQDGFSLAADNVNCVDIDECAVSNPCAQQCNNIYGSYICLCNRGFRTGSDGVSCEDVDECDLTAKRGARVCMGVCQNLPGSYRCSCPPGYNLARDGTTCRDINECDLGTDNCADGQTCFNTRGGYRCHSITCPSSFVKTSATGGSQDAFRCVKQRCQPSDTDCLLDTRAAISYSNISLPSDLPAPRTLLTLTAIISSLYPRVRFTIARGNEDGYFDVIRHGLSGTIRLKRQITGPYETVLQFEMDRLNNANQVLSKTVAVIYVFVSQYPF